MRQVVLFAAALLVGGTAHAESVKISIPSDSAGFAQYFVAENRGYFQDEGLEVEILQLQGGPATPALIAGSTQFSASTSSATTANLKGAPLKVVLIGQSRPQTQLWSFDPAVRTFEDIKGKVVTITSRGGADHILLRMLLKQNGLPPDYFGVAPLGGNSALRIAAVTSGAQKYITLSRLERLDLETLGFLAKGKMVVTPAQHIELPLAGLATTEDMLQKQKTTVKKMLRAVWKGTIHFQMHREDAVVALQKRLPTMTRENMMRDIDGAIDDLDNDGVISMETASRELSIRADLLEMAADKVPAPQKVYDFSLIGEVTKELQAEGWKPKR